MLIPYLDITETSAICPHCGQHLHASDVDSYPFVCLSCDENFYTIEADHDRNKEFEIFIPLDKKAKGLVPKIQNIAKKYNAVCAEYNTEKQGISIIFTNMKIALNIDNIRKEINQIPHVKLGMTLYETIVRENNKTEYIEEILGCISPNGLSYKNQTYDLYLESKYAKSYTNLTDIGQTLFPVPESYKNPNLVPEQFVVNIDDNQKITIDMNETTALNEPVGWLILSDETSIEICHEEEGYKVPFYSVRRHCSETDFDNEKYATTCGIIESYVCNNLYEVINKLTELLTTLQKQNISIKE